MKQILIILALLCIVCIKCGAQAGVDTSFHTKNGDYIIITQGDTIVVYSGKWETLKSSPRTRKMANAGTTKKDLFWAKFVNRKLIGREYLLQTKKANN